jgi:brefeldin A-resistance guanine nucleotide exchange factor 1
MIDDAQVENPGFPHQSRSLSTAVVSNKNDSAMASSTRPSIDHPDLNGGGAYSNHNHISVAVDPVALITTECITVTSAMRKHARWAHSSVSTILGGSSSPSTSGFQASRPSTPGDDLGSRTAHKGKASAVDEDIGLASRWGLRGKKGKSMQDNPLMAGFGRLRRELVGCKGTHTKSM